MSGHRAELTTWVVCPELRTSFRFHLLPNSQPDDLPGSPGGRLARVLSDSTTRNRRRWSVRTDGRLAWWAVELDEGGNAGGAFDGHQGAEAAKRRGCGKEKRMPGCEPFHPSESLIGGTVELVQGWAASGTHWSYRDTAWSRGLACLWKSHPQLVRGPLRYADVVVFACGQPNPRTRSVSFQHSPKFAFAVENPYWRATLALILAACDRVSCGGKRWQLLDAVCSVVVLHVGL